MHNTRPGPVLRLWDVVFMVHPTPLPMVHVKRVRAWSGENAQTVALAPHDLRPTSRRVVWHTVRPAEDD